MDDHCNNFFHRVLRGGTSVGKRERGGGGGRERGSGLYSSIRAGGGGGGGARGAPPRPPAPPPPPERGSGLYSSITHPPTHPLASFCVNGVIRMLSSNPYDFVFYVRPLTHIRYRYQQL
jgi:hypothetical protein